MYKQTSSNAITQPVAKHRRQSAWQILIPFLFVAAAITVLMVLVLVGTSASGNLDHLTSISILWLAIPALFIALAVLDFLIMNIFLIAKITRMVPLAGLKVSTIVYQAAILIHKAADSAAAPSIKIKETMAGVRAIFHRN